MLIAPRDGLSFSGLAQTFTLLPHNRTDTSIWHAGTHQYILETGIWSLRINFNIHITRHSHTYMGAYTWHPQLVRQSTKETRTQWVRWLDSPCMLECCQLVLCCITCPMLKRFGLSMLIYLQYNLQPTENTATPVTTASITKGLFMSDLSGDCSQQSRGYIKRNTNMMQHCAGFTSAESLYMFRVQAPIIRSI